MTAGNYSAPHNQSNELLLAGAFCPPPRSAFVVRHAKSKTQKVRYAKSQNFPKKTYNPNIKMKFQKKILHFRVKP